MKILLAKVRKLLYNIYIRKIKNLILAHSNIPGYEIGTPAIKRAMRAKLSKLSCKSA